MKKKFGDRVAVLALAVESEEGADKKLRGEMGLPFGRETFYGAPPDLHAKVETEVARLLSQ